MNPGVYAHLTTARFFNKEARETAANLVGLRAATQQGGTSRTVRWADNNEMEEIGLVMCPPIV